MKNYALLLLTLPMVPLAACESYVANTEHVTASRIARPAFMVERTIKSSPFPLYAWERTRERGEKAVVYIEGAKESNPVALHLASRDRNPNVIYLAQPCQYSTYTHEACPSTSFSMDEKAVKGPVINTPEALAAFHAALDDYAVRHSISGFDLVGFDEGANTAALLAADRKDIKSLRTVVGKLNPSDGQSATAIAPQLATMPQHHFIGAADGDVIPETYHLYRQAMGESNCVHYTMVQDADHTRGWVEEWPQFLQYPVECTGETFEDYNPEPFPPLPPDKGLRK